VRRAALSALALAAALQLASCKGEEITQIVVVVDSDFDGFDRIEIAVDGFTKETNVGASVADEPLPRRLTLVHDGGPLGPISVKVSAFVANETEPALVERRAGILFQRDKALMLKVDLLFACIGKCDEACLAGPRCVTAAEATSLTGWDSDYDPLGVSFHLDAGAAVDWRDGGPTPIAPDAGPLDDGGPVMGSDAGDAGPSSGGSSGGGSGTGGKGDSGEGGSGGSGEVDAGHDPLFPFDPSNFDPEILRDVDLMSATLDCDDPTFDSTDGSFSDWCGAEPVVTVVEQSDDSELVVLAMSSLSVEIGTTLHLIGDRPVALAVLGDASVHGTIDASAAGATPGGGGLASCATGGSAGNNETLGGSGGGSGGGFGSPGGAGGSAYIDVVRVSGGTVAGSSTLSPLRGGCPGGAGGTSLSPSADGGAGGGGGGAFQLTVGGELTVDGELLASGGGGQAGADARDGGGGGGSGGAILLEAGSYDIDTDAVIAANGGSGGGGQPSEFSTASSQAGVDGPASSSAAPGGSATGSGGDGGAGASLLTASEDGVDGSSVLSSGGAGGGGGGGVGRIRILGASSCAPSGVFSPQPSVACSSCADDCPSPPVHGCVAAELDAAFYYVCHVPALFAEARSNCNDADMALVRVDDQDENDWLVDSGLDDLWIGASDAMTEDDWRWLLGDEAFWSGDENGDPVDDAYNAWTSNEPNGSGDGAMLQTSTGMWLDRSDSEENGYVCELPP
jgi:hypothetical protein